MNNNPAFLYGIIYISVKSNLTNILYTEKKHFVILTEIFVTAVSLYDVKPFQVATRPKLV